MAATAKTGFFRDERCFWHNGGNHALTTPVGGFVQPRASGGSPDGPETRRRLENLPGVSGVSGEPVCRSAPRAAYKDLARVHPGAICWPLSTCRTAAAMPPGAPRSTGS